MDQRGRRAGPGARGTGPAGGRRGCVISSPTITSSPEPAVERHRAGRQGGVDPLVVGDGDDVEHGLALDAVEDLGHRRRPVRGERVDVEIGPAEPVGGVREAVARRHRGGVLVEVRPDRVEGAPPLLGGVGEQRLERRRDRRRLGDEALAARPALGLGDADDAAPVAPAADPARGRREDGDADLLGQQRGADRDRRRVAEERDVDPGPREVPIDDDADRVAAAQGPEHRPARVDERDDVDADPAAGASRTSAAAPGRRPAPWAPSRARRRGATASRPAARWRRSACRR